MSVAQKAGTPQKLADDSLNDSIELPSFASNLCDSTLFTLLLGPQEIPIAVHSKILSKLPFFKVACTGNFKEAKERVICLPEDDPYAMGVLLEYLYTDSFIERLTLSGQYDDKECCLHAERLVQISVVANKYGAKPLETEAYRKFHAIFFSTILPWKARCICWKLIYKYTDASSPLRLRYPKGGTRVKWEEYGRSLDKYKVFFNQIRDTIGDEEMVKMFIDYPELGYDIYTVLVAR